MHPIYTRTLYLLKLPPCLPHNYAHVCNSVVTSVFSLDRGFFCFIWGSGVFIENLFFYSGQFYKYMLYHCIFHSRKQQA